MMHKFPAIPRICINAVDVRDVARAHVIAMKLPAVSFCSSIVYTTYRPQENGLFYHLKACGRLFFCSALMTLFVLKVFSLFKQFQLNMNNWCSGLKVASKNLPNCILTIGALFSNEIKLAKSFANKNVRLDNKMVCSLV